MRLTIPLLHLDFVKYMRRTTPLLCLDYAWILKSTPRISERPLICTPGIRLDIGKTPNPQFAYGAD